jgi:histone H3/H4
MQRRTELEIQKAAIVKAVRTNIRLKHSLAADKEIAETLHEIEQRIDDALQAGTQISFNPAYYLEH